MRFLLIIPVRILLQPQFFISTALDVYKRQAVSLLIQGIVSDWMDVLSIYICPLGAGLAGIMFFWVFGKDDALD